MSLAKARNLIALSSVGILLLMAACAPKDDAKNVDEPEVQQEKLRTNCLQKLNEITCVINDNGVCSGDGTKYTRQLRKIYEFYPDELKAMFCKLDRIQIDPELYELGQFHQTFSETSDNVLMRKISLRKTLFEEELTVSAMLSLEEQRFFGEEGKGRLSEQNWTAGGDLSRGPIIDAEVPAPEGVHAPLLLVLTHELGHLVDAHFEIYLTEDCRPSLDLGIPHCPVNPGEFAGLSWAEYDRPLKKPELIYRRQVNALYNGDEEIFIPLDEAGNYYRSLYQSRFVTSYSARSPAEDFAESFLYYFLERYYPEFYYRVQVQGESYSMRQKLNSKVFSAKKQKIEEIFNLLAEEIQEDDLDSEE